MKRRSRYTRVRPIAKIYPPEVFMIVIAGSAKSKNRLYWDKPQSKIKKKKITHLQRWRKNYSDALYSVAWYVITHYIFSTIKRSTFLRNAPNAQHAYVSRRLIYARIVKSKITYLLYYTSICCVPFWMDRCFCFFFIIGVRFIRLCWAQSSVSRVVAYSYEEFH